MVIFNDMLYCTDKLLTMGSCCYNCKEDTCIVCSICCDRDVCQNDLCDNNYKGRIPVSYRDKIGRSFYGMDYICISCGRDAQKELEDEDFNNTVQETNDSLNKEILELKDEVHYINLTINEQIDMINKLTEEVQKIKELISKLN